MFISVDSVENTMSIKLKERNPMTSEEDLSILDKQLAEYAASFNSTNQKEIDLNKQISALRLEIGKLRDDRFFLNQKIKKATQERESLVRMVELEKEAAVVKQSLEEKRT